MDISELDPKTIRALYSSGFLEPDKINGVWHSSDVTVGEAMASWEGYLAQSRTKSAITHLRSDINAFFHWFFERSGVDSRTFRDQMFPIITPDDLKKYKKAVQNFSTETINRKRGSLDNFFGYCIEKYAMLLPKVDFNVEAYRSYHLPAYRRDEIIAVAESADMLPKALIMFIFETGLKRSEVVECKVKNINLDTKMIKLTNDQGEIQRTITFSGRLETVLWDYMNYVDERRRDYNEQYFDSSAKTGRQRRYIKKSPYLFCAKRTDKLSFSIIETELKLAARNYFYNERIIRGETPVQAEAYADERSAKFTTEALRGSKKAYMIASGKSLDEVCAAMGGESKAYTRRYIQIAKQLYPEKF